MLHYRPNIRKVAGLLLLVWTFALGSSMAHACGLTAHDASHGHHGKAAAIAADHHADTQGQEDDSSEGPATATCVKFCDDAKAVSSSSVGIGDVLTLGLLPLEHSMPIYGDPLVAELITARTRGSVDRPPLPIAIEYLRLAL